MKKLNLTIMSLAATGIMSFVLYTNIGDTWSPKVTQDGHADFPAPAYNIGDTPVQQA
ncbi:TPA: Phr family secreted Rap phosphatase inhibitor [Bacillus pseudomycoides]|nr:Phr family secreted Rap phosphatase inhibitor [Bacillus pseudomycoides]